MYASNSQATFSVSNFSRTERNSNGRSSGDSRNVRNSTGSNIDRKQAEMMKHFMQAMNAFASGFSGTAHAGTGANGSNGSNGANGSYGSNGHCGTSGSQAGGKGSAGGMGSGNAHGKDDCRTQGNSGRGTSGKNDCNTQSNGGRGTSGKNDCDTQSNGGRGTSGKNDCNSHGKEDNHCNNNSNGKDDSACDWTTSEVKNNQTSVDLGDYKLDFNKADSSMILTNKTTGDATQVWGDPHIDFHSAGASSKQNDATFKGPLTFQLPDNTKVTLGTQPVANNPGVTVTNKVTITQGNNSIVVDNLNQFNGGDLQVTKGRDGRALDAAAPDGYTLVQQKDGKGWVGSDTGRAPTQADFDKLGV